MPQDVFVLVKGAVKSGVNQWLYLFLVPFFSCLFEKGEEDTFEEQPGILY